MEKVGERSPSKGYGAMDKPLLSHHPFWRDGERDRRRKPEKVRGKRQWRAALLSLIVTQNGERQLLATTTLGVRDCNCCPAWEPRGHQHLKDFVSIAALPLTAQQAQCRLKKTRGTLLLCTQSTAGWSTRCRALLCCPGISTGTE